ncbi:MAG: hypothetical protein IJ025_05880 [Clostridia bacterium]|nr:hypothetical protein [Clostridia bacterium]
MKKLLSIILAILMIVSVMPMAFAGAEPKHTYNYKVGDIVQFGTYPQSEVTDENLKAALDALAPEWENWTSYGYYSYTDSGVVEGDWMRYTDVTYNGDKYRGVKFIVYRPMFTFNIDGSVQYTTQDDYGYYENIVYWFKFEPVNWRVLDPEAGLVLSEIIIDAQPFTIASYVNGTPNKKSITARTVDYFSDAAMTMYANNYETSSIRQWLNDDFYNTAFADGEKEEIMTTTLNNDSYNTLKGIAGYEKYDANETNDKVFLLSSADAENSDYGFTGDEARATYLSSYAKCQGIFIGNQNVRYWSLRNAGVGRYGSTYIHSRTNATISLDGSITSVSIYGTTQNHGIRPAMTLDMDTVCLYPHSIVENEAKAPTCTEIGWEAHQTCSVEGCSYSTYEELPALGHIDENGNDICERCCCDDCGRPVHGDSLIEKIFCWFVMLINLVKSMF